MAAAHPRAHEVPSLQLSPAEGPAAGPAAAGAAVEEAIRDLDESAKALAEAEITAELLTTELRRWQQLETDTRAAIELSPARDEALVERLRTGYREAVTTAVAAASRKLGVAEPELYARHDKEIAWWLRQEVAPREAIAFVLGEDPFAKAAIEFYGLAQVRTVTDRRSLRDVRDWLEENTPANGLPWGEVNIVQHADLEGGIQTPVIPGGAKTNPESLREAIAAQQFLPLPDEIVDDATRLVIRGCALGRNQEMLELLRSAFGGNEESPQIYAPVHLQAYTSSGSEQYFERFWYVGLPAEPKPQPAELAERFASKYPDEEIDWEKLAASPGMTDTYSVAYEIEEAAELPSEGEQGEVALARLVKKQFPESDTWTRIEEKSRKTDARGLTRIEVGYRERGTRGTVVLRHLLPPMDTQLAYRQLLARQSDLLAASRRLEEGSNLGADDFFWELTRTPNDEGSFLYLFTGRRTLVRVQQELVEPVPSQPGETRRVQPDLSEASHFGRALPSQR